MSRVRLVDVSKRYASAVAVDHVSADIANGEFVTLLGPSGCGKTTTLRMIAGLVEPSAGDILFDDQSVVGIPPNKRNIGLAFQSHALFPHLTVARNVAFGLEVKGEKKQVITERVKEMLAMVELTDYANRLPAQLSGGQQQRVALARMLATNPRVLLFDEPLSALDRNLRDTLKYSILNLQRRTGKTAIYVTHDQSEAFAISDRIFVMNRGKIEQAGTQLDIYLRPQTEFVANFVGDNNAFRGKVVAVTPAGEHAGQVTITSGGLTFAGANLAGLTVGDDAIAFVRPENIALRDDNPVPAPNILPGTIDEILFGGAVVRLVVDFGGVPVRVSVGGLQRLDLLDASSRKVVLEAGAVSIVADPEAASA